MENTQTTIEEKITRYALIIFAILLLLIIYTFFTTEPSNTDKQVTAQATTPIQPLKTEHTIQKVASTPAITQTPHQTATTIKTSQKEEAVKMKLDDHKKPASPNPKQKLTDLLPKELKENIQASLPSEEEIKAMTPEERAKFKQTQKKLAVVLRDIGRTEAENQQLEKSLANAEVKKQQLNTELKKVKQQ